MFIFTNKNLALAIAGYIFALMAIVHLVRIVTQFNIVIAGYTLSTTVSIYGFIIAAALAFWMIKLSRS